MRQMFTIRNFVILCICENKWLEVVQISPSAEIHSENDKRQDTILGGDGPNINDDKLPVTHGLNNQREFWYACA